MADSSSVPHHVQVGVWDEGLKRVGEPFRSVAPAHTQSLHSLKSRLFSDPHSKQPLYYVDDEGDRVTIVSEEEYAEALLQHPHLLRLAVSATAASGVAALPIPVKSGGVVPPPNVPVVCIYTLLHIKPSSDTVLPSEPMQLADAEALRKVLLKCGAEEKAVKIMDASSDFELQYFLRKNWPVDVPTVDKSTGKVAISKDKPRVLTYPLAVLWGQDVIGDLTRVGALDAAGMLKTKLADRSYLAPPSWPEGERPAELELGFVNKCLDVTEKAGSALGTVISAPLGLLAWPFAGESGEDDGSKAKENDLDFAVVHTNWYWRSLDRIFRLSDKSLMRLHPVHKDVRAVHDYSCISNVTFVDHCNAIIKYTDGSAADYIRAPPGDLKRMAEVMHVRSGKKIILDGAYQP